MAKRKPAPTSTPTRSAPGRWLLVEASLQSPNRHRNGQNCFPIWWVRVHSVIGRTPVESLWKPTDLNVSEPFRALVRVPGWAKGIHVGYGHQAGLICTDCRITNLGATDPRPKLTDLDSEFYNLTTVIL